MFAIFVECITIEVEKNLQYFFGVVAIVTLISDIEFETLFHLPIIGLSYLSVLIYVGTYSESFD